MMSTLTGGCIMSRQVLRWLDSLDLSFSVKNPKIDLANGFIVAQILSRYYPKQVNIYSFYNNQAKDKRLNNWEQIQKVLQKKEFSLGKDEYESIANLAPETALNLVYRLYEFLTQKKIKNDNRTIVVSDNLPLFMKPTASHLAKDRELGRIVDANQKERKTKKIIGSHMTSIKNKKYTTGLIDWLINKRKVEISEEVRRQEEQLAKRTRTLGTQFRGEVKEIQLKCFDSSASKHGNFGSKTRGIVDFLLDSLSIYLKKDFVVRDTRRLDVQLKQKDGGQTNALREIFLRCDQYQEDRLKVSPTTLEYLVKQLNQPAEIGLVFQNIKNSFVDFKKYFSLFVPALKQYDCQDTVYTEIVQLLTRISIKLVEQDYQSTQMMFKELVLEQYIQVSVQDRSKTHSICEIILSFTKQVPINQYEMITAVRESLREDYQYLAYLSYFISIILVTTGEIEQNLWSESYQYAIKGLNSASPVTRTNSAKIISDLIIFSDESFSETLATMAKLISDEWWEVKVLTLVVFSRLIISKSKRQQGQEPSLTQEHQSVFEEITRHIETIFHPEADERIIKIGLVQLAQLLNYQKSLCKRYLEVLLGTTPQVLAEVVNTQDNKIGKVDDTPNTFEYRLTGAASQWDPVGVSLALVSNIKQNNLQELQEKHLSILISCVDRGSEIQHQQVWLEVYEELKTHLFRALKNSNVCTSASEVIKKLFGIQVIHHEMMKTSRPSIRQLLCGLYEDKQMVPQDNLLSLLSYFSTFSPEMTQYVYQSLKLFSEEEKDKYLSSNLVEFMNQLARRRRGAVFGS